MPDRGEDLLPSVMSKQMNELLDESIEEHHEFKLRKAMSRIEVAIGRLDARESTIYSVRVSSCVGGTISEAIPMSECRGSILVVDDDPDLGGHPKPASEGHLKTGQS